MCILQGPVAAKWSIVKDEPVKDLLDNINKALIQRLLERKYGGDMSAVPTIDYLAVQCKAFPKSLPGVTRTEGGNLVTFKVGSTLPETESWFRTLAGSELGNITGAGKPVVFWSRVTQVRVWCAILQPVVIPYPFERCHGFSRVF